MDNVLRCSISKNCLFRSVSFSGLQSFCGVSSSNLLFFVDNFVDVMIKYYLMIKYSSCLVLILFKKILFFPCLFFSTPSMICREFGNKIASHFVIRSAPFWNKPLQWTVVVSNTMLMLCWISLSTSPLEGGCKTDSLSKHSLQNDLDFLLEF